MSTSVQRCIGAPRRLLGAVVPADSRAGGVPFDQKPPVGVEVLLEQPAAGDVFAAYVHPFAEVGVVEARLSDPSPAHDDDSGEHGAVKVAEPDFGLFESGPFDLAVAEVAPCDLRPAETAVAQHGLAEGDALHPAAVEIALRERAFVECHVFHTAAFEIMLAKPEVKVILVNIFGGIMKCDVIAEGIVEACRHVKLTVPLIVRMKGTHEKEGKEILKNSGLPIISAESLGDAAKKAVELAAEK